MARRRLAVSPSSAPDVKRRSREADSRRGVRHADWYRAKASKVEPHRRWPSNLWSSLLQPSFAGKAAPSRSTTTARTAGQTTAQRRGSTTSAITSATTASTTLTAPIATSTTLTVAPSSLGTGTTLTATVSPGGRRICTIQRWVHPDRSRGACRWWKWHRLNDYQAKVGNAFADRGILRVIGRLLPRRHRTQ